MAPKQVQSLLAVTYEVMAKIQLLFDEELLLLPEKPEIPACNMVDETEASFTAGAENG